MKHQKSAAIILSAAMLCSQLPLFPAFSVSAADIPAWVPQDFEHALEFQNTYGATHAEDGVYCIVERINTEFKPECAEHLAEGSAERIFQKEITYEFKDGMPNLQEMSAKERAEWEARFEQQGIIDEYNKNVHYFVSVWKPTKASENEIIRQVSFTGSGNVEPTQPMPVSYTFAAADDVFHVTETGWRAYMPDCKTEYDAFQKEHGYFYAEDEFLIVAGTVNYSTGADMNIKVTLNGSQELQPDYTTNCRVQGMMEAAPGSSENYAKCYQLKFGQTGHIKARIDWTEAQPGQEHSATGYFSSQMVTNGTKYRMIVSEEDPRPDDELPEWVPTDFRSACEFHNQYGTSLAKDGIICIIARFDTTEQMDENSWICAAPVGAAGSGAAEYTEITKKFYPMKYEYDYYDTMTHYYYVSVWKPKTAGSVVLYGTQNPTTESPNNEDMYTFTVDEHMQITETDWRGFVPDCEQERREFISADGSSYGLGTDNTTACNIDSRGDYLVFAAFDVAMLNRFMEATAAMDGKALTLTRVNCDHRWDEVQPTDSTGAFAQYCKITKPGTITANFRSSYTGQTVTQQTFDAVKDTAGVITVTRRSNDSVPAWAPTSFEKAAEFFKDYGLIRSESGKLVICLPYTVSDQFRYVLDDPGIAGGTAAHKSIFQKSYTEGNQGYFVEVYQVTSSGNFGMKWLRVPEEGSDVTQMRLYTLSFDVGENLLAREMEATASLPGSFTEAEKWIEENSSVCVKNGFIYCAGSTNPTTGYSIIPEITGTAVVDPVTQRRFGKDFGAAGATGGGCSDHVYQYKPVMPGIVKVTVRHAQEWNLNLGEVLATKFYEIADDLTIKEIQLTEGDLNGDNKLTIADAVSLSKHLGGQLKDKEALSEKQFLAADMRADGRLNAADLTVMKQKLFADRNAAA